MFSKTERITVNTQEEFVWERVIGIVNRFKDKYQLQVKNISYNTSGPSKDITFEFFNKGDYNLYLLSFRECSYGVNVTLKTLDGLDDFIEKYKFVFEECIL